MFKEECITKSWIRIETKVFVEIFDSPHEVGKVLAHGFTQISGVLQNYLKKLSK